MRLPYINGDDERFNSASKRMLHYLGVNEELGMRLFFFFFVMCFSLSALFVTTARAQQGLVLEEIVVTARKREENLQEIPVSISVVGGDLIQEAGIIDPRDLFELTPGLDFDTNGDRNNATPSVRGIQSKATATTRQKVMSFIDGLPLVGAQGTMQFADIQRVEVFRGPQSAAFGRATFAGAINYVTRDPGEEFEANLNIGTSSLGRSNITLGLGGPISDTLGYTLDINSDSFEGDDSWVSTEGFDIGGTETQYLSGKLTFAPNDRVDGEIRVSSLRTNDDMQLRYYIGEAALTACANFQSPNKATTKYVKGTWDCDTAAPVGGIPTNTDTAAPFKGTADEALAASYAIQDPQTTNERDRLQGELNFSFDNGDLQFLSFYSEEMYIRWADGDKSDTPLSIAMGMVMGMSVNHMADPTDITETMLEVRWVSPEDAPVRWSAGMSIYDYEFLTLVWSQYAGILAGQQAALAIQPNVIISEDSTNQAVFANLTYDLTDRTTFSLEGRYQSEDMTNVNQITSEAFTNTTKAFVPRIALNHTLDNGATLYAQWASGINPAGVIPAARSPRIVAAHKQVYDLGLVEWKLDDVLFYAEEEITNLEFGIKAGLADNRVQFAGAIYAMDWEHYNQAYTLAFDVDTLAREKGITSPGKTTYNGSALGPGDYRLRAQLDLGSANVYGVEGEVSWFASDNWDFRGTIAWQQTEYETFCDPDGVQTIGLTPTNLVTDGSGVLFNCVSAIGNEFSRQPDLAYSLAATYRTPLGGSGWDLVGRLDYRYIGEQWLDNVNYAAMPASDTVNASVNFRKDNWDVRLYGRNLTDDDTPRIIQNGNDYNLSQTRRNFHILPREPREYGIGIRYSF